MRYGNLRQKPKDAGHWFFKVDRRTAKRREQRAAADDRDDGSDVESEDGRIP